MYFYNLKNYYTPSVYKIFIEGRPNNSENGYYTDPCMAKAHANVHYDVVHDSIYLLRLDWNEEEECYCYTGEREKIEEIKASQDNPLRYGASLFLAFCSLFLAFLVFISCVFC